MAIEKLSASKVERLTKPGKHGDGGGLYLQITKKGVKSWIFRYEINGSERYMGLGPLRAVDIWQARKEAQMARACLDRKADPMQERTRIIVAEKKNAEHNVVNEKVKIEYNGCNITLNQCIIEYIAHHKDGWKSKKHCNQWKSSLNTYALSIGEMLVHEINTALVLQVLKPIWFEKTETASRLRGRIERVLSWATVCGYRTGDNPARWNGHLQELLPKPSRIIDPALK